MEASKPKVGDRAPVFEAIMVGGGTPEPATVKLGDFAGRPLVLYFYPKDDTPGCTTQACGIRDQWGALSEKAAIVGVSIDPVGKHEKFIAKYDLPFPLLSDGDKEIAQKFGVCVEKSLYGKKYMGTERTTFVIGDDGVILAVFPKVKPADHVDLILGALA